MAIAMTDQASLRGPQGRGNHRNDGHLSPWRLMGRGGLGVELDAQGGGDFEDGGETGVALS